MRILILGGTGFIGSAVMQRLAADGHAVTGLARNVARARARWPQAQWIAADLADLQTAAGWRPHLDGFEIVVNCAGALQDGLADDLAASQQNAMLALYEAAKTSTIHRTVQISARVDGSGADLPFLATKRRADMALAESGLPFVIVRPALVVGRNAFGGTALLRALAAFPFVQPLIHPESPVETVDVEDVAAAVALAVEGAIPSGSDLELAAPERLTLVATLALHRRWLGLAPAPAVVVPGVLARAVTALADLAGRLGWQSPLRSTAMTVMEGGVTRSNEREPPPFAMRTLSETLAAHPPGVQDLWFARLYLIKTPVIVTLSLFWLLSGLLPLADVERAASHFLPLLPPAAATTATLLSCLLDITLGVCVLLRPLARRALLGMLAVTALYLAAASVVEPALWLDPLGPLVKVLPSVLLTLTSLAILDNR